MRGLDSLQGRAYLYKLKTLLPRPSERCSFFRHLGTSILPAVSQLTNKQRIRRRPETRNSLNSNPVLANINTYKHVFSNFFATWGWSTSRHMKLQAHYQHDPGRSLQSRLSPLTALSSEFERENSVSNLCRAYITFAYRRLTSVSPMPSLVSGAYTTFYHVRGWTCYFCGIQRVDKSVTIDVSVCPTRKT